MTKFSLSPRLSQNSGVALVLVLALLVLVTVVVVAFLELAKTERKSASVVLASAGIRELADNAVGIVQAQINQSTTRGPTVAWASQPGMIRTYDASGSLDTAYKLFSALTLTETTVGKLGNDPAANDDIPPAAWASSSAIWTDLNAPVNANGGNVFPILDPGMLDFPAARRPLGFDVLNAPGSTSSQRAPMPVRWLYVLKDGRIVAPTGSGALATIPGAGPNNEILGRIAFWTDDESCKVNVNTSGEGGFWDTPRYSSTEDRKFATSQPLNGEFQRYPGHPAMTSLSAVFPQLKSSDILSTLTPRYQWGGSEQGTVDTFRMTSALNNGTVADRPLYADTDEMIFPPSRTTRAKNTLLSRDAVEQARFFLTTDSRAPEINLFNLPRIACWPASVDTNSRTAFDKVIAFAASIGSSPYYFQRQNALSPTDDVKIERNRQLFGYLQYLTDQKIPGFGVDLAGKFGVDRDQILTEIWDYIRCSNLYDTRLPTGKQFTAANTISGDGYGYVVPLDTGTSSDLKLPGNPRGFGRSLTASELAFVFLCSADPVDTQNTPANPKGMMGSNDPSLNKTLPSLPATGLSSTQRRVQMMILPELFSPSQGNILIRPKFVRITISGLSSLKLGGTALFPGDSESFRLNDSAFNMGNYESWNGGPFDYRAVLGGGTNRVFAPVSFDASQPSYYAKYPFISQFVTVTVPTPGASDAGTMTFATGPLSMTIETSTDNASWTTSQVIPITPPPSSAIPIPNLVRTGTPTGPHNTLARPAQFFWAFTFNTPWRNDPTSTRGRLFGSNQDVGSFQISSGVPIGSGSGAMAGSLIREAEDASHYADVVRSMAISHGDARLISTLRDVPGEAFTPVGDWSATGPANAVIHTLGTGQQSSDTIPGGGQYRRHFVTSNPAGGGASYGSGGQWAPDFRSDSNAPVSVLQAVAASNDFDNGTGYWPDGAYINKPDEGNIYLNAAMTPYFTNDVNELLNSAGFFSPNRIMPGPGMFGSLPTHVKRYALDPLHPENYAWRTLLFRKQPGHPNAVTVSPAGIPSAAPDHLLMDLFWMPAVEPYAISEPFSTAGKVNMNYELQPFTYIQRKTGMYAVLQNEKIPAVDNSASSYATYKAQTSTPGDASFRLKLDIPETLQQFDARFANSSGRIFLSPTELCDLWLVPQGQSQASMETFWKSHNLTGDNMRERPYATIIPRLTTKSNTFTVHYRVQTLKSPMSIPAGTWDETKGIITGEYRGSRTIQRFIDLNDQTLLSTDFAVNTGEKTTLDTFYRWRVINNKQFAP